MYQPPGRSVPGGIPIDDRASKELPIRESDMGEEGILRYAVIGTGQMGKKYARMLKDHQVRRSAVTAVVARSAANQEWARENLGEEVLICRDEDELYQHGEVFDAVLITTPHRLHPAMAVRAIQEGKCVLCDKPSGASIADAVQINRTWEQTCSSNGSMPVFGMMFHQRTYGKYRRIKDLLQHDALGKITRVQMENSRYFRTDHYHRSSPWRSSWEGEGGGALINQGSHLLDIWQWLFGLPVSIYAMIPFGKYNDFMVDDEATLFMEYPDKMTGTFILSTQEGTWLERLEIVGTRGRILMENDTLTCTCYRQDTRAYASSAMCDAREELTEVLVEKKDYPVDDRPYINMLDNFWLAAVAGEPLIAPGIEGINSLEIINASYLSAWKGRKISLPIDPWEYDKELKQHVKLEQDKKAAEAEQLKRDS